MRSTNYVAVFSTLLPLPVPNATDILFSDTLGACERPRFALIQNNDRILVLYGGELRHADHVALSIRKSWQSLRRQAAVARSV
jgi:hypothetical protein